MKCRGPDITKIRAKSSRPKNTIGPVPTDGTEAVSDRLGYAGLLADILILLMYRLTTVWTNNRTPRFKTMEQLTQLRIYACNSAASTCRVAAVTACCSCSRAAFREGSASSPGF